MKYKEQIIGVVILCAVFGGMFAVWQFHFKDIFAGYRSDEALRETLERTYQDLVDTFQGYNPEVLIEAWQTQVQPWRDAREERASFFTFGDWYDVEVTPEESRMLKFWYAEESNRMVTELYTRVYERMGGYDRFPQDIRGVFNIQREDDWADGDITIEQVRMNLGYLNFADSLTEFLLAANVTSVETIVNWPRRIPNAFSELLVLQTVGVRFTISARDLTRMLDELRQERRYFSVEAIRVSYPYIAYNVEPQLNVSLLLTQANYRPPADIEPTEAPALETTRRVEREAGPAARRRPVSADEVGPIRRFWIWFRRNVLYIN